MYALFFIICFFAMLCFPAAVLSGARDGLLLWFNVVLPTLFPFILICNLCIRTNALSFLLHITRPLLCRIFKVSSCGSFAVLSGFLCGYPMGGKVAADLYRRGCISQEECAYLLSFCNNVSPMFIISILVAQNLKMPSMTLPTLLLLLGSPMLLSFLFRHVRFAHTLHSDSDPLRHTLSSSKVSSDSSHQPLSSSKISSASLRHTSSSVAVSDTDPLDASISDALEAIAKVGAYIIAFSVLTKLLALLPFPTSALKLLLLSSLEVTQGVSLICASPLAWNTKYILCLFFTSFGGFCAAAQTHSMLQGTDVSLSSYLIKKLVTALVTSLLGCIYLFLF